MKTKYKFGRQLPWRGLRTLAGGTSLMFGVGILWMACDSQVIIKYHQVGACNGFPTGSGVISVGPNAAYVLFGIESIDNSQGTTAFSFDPTKVMVPSEGAFDPNNPIYPAILGPFAASPIIVPAGQSISFQVSAQGAVVVSTVAPDGASEADHTSYTLTYKTGANDPGVLFESSVPSQTSWPYTPSCKDIALH